MIKNSAPVLDLDNLLVIAAEKGCACGIRPCLIHYAEDKRREETRSREAYTVLKNKLEVPSAQPDRSSAPVNPVRQPRGQQRADAAVRGDRPGDRDRPAKAVRKSARKR